MNILWFSWKDRRHPEAGGAEIVSSQIMDRLVRDGHTVRHITALYPGASQNEDIDGVDTYRTGGRFSVYLKARSLYNEFMPGWEDIVIDEMNTIPFVAARYTKAPTKMLLAYQLAREVWFYQMLFPISLAGYLLEPLMLRWVSRKYPLALTESASSQRDMQRHGFKEVRIFKVGMALKPLKQLPKKTSKIILSLGGVRPMKRTLHAVKAFEYARDTNKSLRMVIAGDTSTSYANRVISYVQSSRHSDAISILGRVTDKERLALMREAAIILVASIKEGWGLIVTEANSQGTPAVVYNVDGLRDSVKDNETGLLAENGSPVSMGAKVIELLKDRERYEKLRTAAWRWSKDFTFENSYKDFLEITGINSHG